MKRTTSNRAFALAVTLVLMALIVVVILAYLANTQTDRATSSLYANKLRAQMMAQSGLAAATQLLRDNMRYGNYITAMPAPSPSPAPLYTEVYRPADPSDTAHAAKSGDYLTLANAAGEILVSRALPGNSPIPQIDPRPTPEAIPSPLPSNSTLGLSSPVPALSGTNSYDFNQLVRIGVNDLSRLVQPSPAPAPPPAYGQWVRVRDDSGQLVGRYAFFVEDESMKINVNFAGNNLALGGAHMRPPDLPVSPTPAPTATPGTQIQELDPAGVLPVSGRGVATANLAGIGPSGARIASNKTLGVVPGWTTSASLENYVHLTTTWSMDDLTTARGWQRMDLNATVANNSPQAATQKIANWINDAWTGPTPVASLQPYQIFGDNRLRLQAAANIVDYIDSDHTPTDFGDVSGYPVIGIEKIPYLVEVDVIYVATAQSPDVAGKANITMKFRVNFMNLFDTDLELANFVKTIKIKGVPIINKNGSAIFNHSTETYELTVDPVGGAHGFPSAPVPWGGDNISFGVQGAKTYYSDIILTEAVNYTPGGSITTFQSGLLTVDVLDGSGNRLDAIKVSLRDLSARWPNTNSNNIANDFLEQRKEAASMEATYSVLVGPPPASTTSTVSFGDPRYRPVIQSARFYNLTRTDTTRFVPTTVSGDDKAEIDTRSSAVDWYDYVGNRPLAFQRDGPMHSIGELGNISVAEFPWRTAYLQYPSRPKNTTDPAVGPAIDDRRGSSTAAATNPDLLPQDYNLLDLFTTSSAVTRPGGLNINTQYNLKDGSGSIPQGVLVGLFSGVPMGGGVPASPTPSPSPSPLPSYLSLTAVSIISDVIANRRSAIAPLASGGPGPIGGNPPIENNPRRPYFTIGQLASDLSWLVSQSENTTSTGNGRTRSTVNYSLLRTTPTTKSQWYRNYGTDSQVEEPYRKVSNSITTRGNVFRVLYVGQAIKDFNRNGDVDTNEVAAEYLGEAFVDRVPVFTTSTVGSSSVNGTADSTFEILAQRSISQ